MLNPVWAVVRREYLQRVRSRWFIVATIGGPLLMAGLMFGSVYVAVQSERSDRDIALVDQTGVLAERVAPRLEEAGFTVLVDSGGDDAIEALTQRSRDGELGGFVVLDDLTLQTGEAVFYAMSRPSAVRRVMMRSAVTRSALEESLESGGLDPSRLLGGGELRVEVVGEGGPRSRGPQLAVGFVGAFLLYGVILLWSVAVMRATLEEKTSRIAEVIVSAMKPWQLMLGKILGVGAVSLTQFFVWAVAVALLLTLAVPRVVVARPELAPLLRIQEFLPGLGGALLFLGYFVFGFFIFSGLYAAVGAMCNSDEEAQQAQLPVMMLVVIPIIFVAPISDDPGTTFAVIMSLIPFFSPILMWPRIAAGVAPVWQIALSFVGMAAALVAVAWIAGRIYKVGMLMTGKRPTLPELLRWVREA